MSGETPAVREALAVYATAAPETERVPPGYKQTEVGVIPEDWEVKRLGDFAPLQRGFDLPNSMLKKGSYPVVYSNGVLAYHIDYKAKGPGVVTGRSGTIGKVNYVEGNYWPHNTALWVTDFGNNLPKFVFYLYLSIGLDRFGTGSGVPTLNRNDVHSFSVAVPTSTKEQRAIAVALSDVDALIAALDKLIAKKRAVKTAAMQQLLTSKQRLPGFSGEWEVKRFAEIASPRRERVDPRKLGSHEFCVELEHIESGTGRLLGSTSTGDQSSLKSVFQVGDVLFGKLRSYLRKYWLADRSGVCSTEFWVLLANHRLVTPEFLFQIVSMDRFVETASTAYGTHMPRADWNVVKNYEVAIPSVKEQTAIAAALSDMDAEISALEARREKTRRIKQGMMQELLTGRTRLV